MRFLRIQSVFLVLSIVSYVVCMAIPTNAPPALQSETQRKRHNEACGFSGNYDLYGLGIRLGMYFQWASTLVIYGWYPEGRDDLVESYLGFLVAIIIAIVVRTAQTEPTYAAEIFALSYIIFGGIYTVMMLGTRQHHLKRIESRARWAQTSTTFIVMDFTGIYYSWFWLRGLHHNVLETPCGTAGFLFTKVSLYNPAVYIFLAALSVLISVLYAYHLAEFSRAIYWRLCISDSRIFAEALQDAREKDQSST